MDAKGQRVASAVRDSPYPSMQMTRHAFSYMPERTEIDRRNKALFAFLMLTGARDGAIASLRLKHINMIDGCVYQDARDVKTKNSKTITTYFLPVDPDYLACFTAWITHLKENALFGPDDPLFPPPKNENVDGEFKTVGLRRDIYKNANAIRAVIKEAFKRADLPPFTPHAFRKTLVKWADTAYPTREAFKAFSQNIGHSNVVTTISAYCPVSTERQGELIKRG
jgi:integrase